MALILVRHGRTAHNATGRLLGRADPPLDELGREQAAAVGRALGDLAVGRVLSSPLGRAMDTAGAIASVIGADVVADERWVELDYGELDGMAIADVDPSVWVRWRADPSFRPPGGESLVDLGLRVRAACDELVAEAADGDVVVVSHVSPVKAAVAWALGTGDEIAWRLHLEVASITRVRIGPLGPLVLRFNDVSHLA